MGKGAGQLGSPGEPGLVLGIRLLHDPAVGIGE